MSALSSAKIPGVILAAGEAKRFQTVSKFASSQVRRCQKKANKLLLPFRGKPVIYHTLKEMLKSQLEPILLVLGYESEKVIEAIRELKHHPKLQIIFNDLWASGRASSVRAAIEKLPEDAPGVLFLPGDMPLMKRRLIDLVANTFRETQKLCFPLHKGEKGHPVVFPKALLSELAQLSGDTSGFKLVKKHWDEAVKLPLEDESTQLDLDTLEDYERLLELE